MWFDVRAALADLDHDPAERPSRVAHVARVARFPASESEASAIAEEVSEAKVIRAIRRGSRRPGVIETTAGLGATVTYELLDRLRARGRLVVRPRG